MDDRKPSLLYWKMYWLLKGMESIKIVQMKSWIADMYLKVTVILKYRFSDTWELFANVT